jgi:hypothetical protein
VLSSSVAVVVVAVVEEKGDLGVSRSVFVRLFLLGCCCFECMSRRKLWLGGCSLVFRLWVLVLGGRS